MPNFKSKLEKTNAKLLDEQKIEYAYEAKEGKIEYVIPASLHTYTPDFPIRTRSGKIIVIETKGIWEYTDRCKHAWIKKQYPGLDIRFVFTRSSAPTSKGARQTYADICEGRGRGIFKGLSWPYANKKIPLEWLNE